MIELDERSKLKLAGVHPDLVRVAFRAADFSDQDFFVSEGVRSPARQVELVRAGASETLASLHLIQADGFAHAMDLGARISGEVRWDWPLFFDLSKVVRLAAIEEDVAIVWGGCWDKALADLSTDTQAESADYIARRKAAGLRYFVDGPHFQLSATTLRKA